ncbi:MAG: hypothetical protein RLZ98_1228 [Pseudomonadota bacterium]|jgi:hypothetical protein
MLTKPRLHPNAQLATVPLIEADAREYEACGESGDNYFVRAAIHALASLGRSRRRAIL